MTTTVRMMMAVWKDEWLLYLVQRWLGLCVLVAVAYSAGWCHRFVWYLVEREATQLLHRTPVTVGQLRVDLWRGRYRACNVIVHAPQRSVYHWEAPVLARIGHVDVQVNLVTALLSLWLFGEEVPLEIYTVQLSDIQVFIERSSQYNVYNFLLLDPNVIVPTMDATSSSSASLPLAEDPILTSTTSRNANAHINTNTKVTDNNSQTHRERRLSDVDSAYLSTAGTKAELQPHEAEKAQQVVDHIVDAVKRAASQGSGDPALHLLKQTLTEQLKALQMAPKKSVAMQESVNLLKQVTANITEKTVLAQQVMVPARKTSAPHPPAPRVVYGRVGRVLIQDLRIFLRDNNNHTRHHLHSRSHIPSGDETSSHDHNHNNHTMLDEDEPPMTTPSSWNPPILIRRLAIRANEFCPPSSAKEGGGVHHKNHQKSHHHHNSISSSSTTAASNNNEDDEENGYDPTLPALYQPLDACLEVVWKRVLTEVAKTHTGRFFQTAMGEVANLFATAQSTATTVNQ